MAAAIHDHEVTIWDVADRRILEVLPLPAPVRALTADGDLMIAAGGEAVFMAFREPATEPKS